MPPFLTFLLAYWKPIAAVAFVFGAWIAGDIHGHIAEKSSCDATISKMKLEANKQQKAWQAQIDQSAAAFEAERAKNSKIFDDAMKGARNDYAKNPDYARCHVGDDFVRAYRSIATGTAIVTKLSE